MAILNRIPRKDIERHFSHYGWLAFCPVYVGGVHNNTIHMVERNWVPEWLLGAAEMVQGTGIFIRTLLDPDYEPAFAVRLTEPIEVSR